MFWKEHSYNFLKMFLNQVAIGLFGLVLYFAASKGGNEGLKLALGIGASVFYLVLVYSTAWGIGSKDFTPVSAGRKQAKPLTGFFVALVSYIPSLICAVFLVLGKYLNQVSFFKTLASVSGLITAIIDGMYVGIFTFGGRAINLYLYFLLVIPGLIISGIAYYLGMKGIRLTPVSAADYPKSDRPTRAEIKKRKETDKHQRNKE